MKTLLDTHVSSEILKGKHPEIRRRAEAYISEHGQFTVSVITVFEVVSGVRRSGSPARLAGFLERLAGVEVLEFDRAATQLSGSIYADFARAGRPIGSVRGRLLENRAVQRATGTRPRHRLFFVGNVTEPGTFVRDQAMSEEIQRPAEPD